MDMIIDALNDKANDKFHINIEPVQIILLWNEKMEDKKLLQKDTSLESKYSARLSTDKKGLIKKISMGKTIRKTLSLDESRVWSFTVYKMERKQLRDYLLGYFFHANAKEPYFRINFTNPSKDLTGLTNLEKKSLHEIFR